MKRRLALALVVLTTTSVFAQTSFEAEIRPQERFALRFKQLQDMKDAISAQQQQILQLQQQVQNRDQAIQTLQQQVGQAAVGGTAGSTGRQRCEQGRAPENARDRRSAARCR